MHNRSFKISAPLMVLAAGMSMLNQPAWATDRDRPYDWTIEAQTEMLIRPFDFDRSSLREIVRARIKYYPSSAEDHWTSYESIWYSNGKPIGLERVHRLNITQGDGISIRIVPKSGHITAPERKAAANIILRMMLDAYINRNPVVTVRLPNDAFDQIIEELHHNSHITDGPEGSEEPVDATLSIFLQSESSGRRQQLYYL